MIAALSWPVLLRRDQVAAEAPLAGIEEVHDADVDVLLVVGAPVPQPVLLIGPPASIE